MHPLNCESTIGRSFFAPTAANQGINLLYLFNVMYGYIPTTLNFSEDFTMSSLEDVGKYFDSFSSSFTKVGEQLFEEGIWAGKSGTKFEGALLSVYFRRGDGETIYPFSEVRLFSPGYHDSSSDVYVGIKAVCVDNNQASELATLFDSHKIQQKSKIFILSSSYGDLEFTSIPSEDMSTDIALNYGDTFVGISEELVNSLNTTKSGLYLFHGAPGTGKSSYIKYLCSGVIKRKLAYIPVGLIGKLVSPDMMPLLMGNKDIVLVIEDAEKALLSRESVDNSDLVSTILNLTDGFLGHALNISVIATFNTSKDKIDEALLRKGRLKLCHEFKELDRAQSVKLAKHLGLDHSVIEEGMTLADIYNMGANTRYEKEEVRRVGFF
jgi:hypothetical protein